MAVRDTRGPAAFLDVVDPKPYLAILEQRFGIPGSVFTGYVVFRQSTGKLSITRRDLRLPQNPDPVAVGMPFFYINMRNPRLTSAAAIKFGIHAERNVLDLDEARMREFVFAREIRLDVEEASGLGGTGYLLGRYRGSVVGLGHGWQEGGGMVVKGMVPKSWAAQLEE